MRLKTVLKKIPEKKILNRQHILPKQEIRDKTAMVWCTKHNDRRNKTQKKNEK